MKYLSLLLMFVGSVCHGQSLVEQGHEIFNNETFGGNGRTCATCHRAEDNFVINPDFIAQLPESDPLFADNVVPGFERRDMLLRGLFEESQDGFDQTRNFRSSMLLSGTSFLNQDPSGPAANHIHALGHSGDGTPTSAVTGVIGETGLTDGSLRDFIDGAIIQHYIIDDGEQVGESVPGGGPIIRTIGGNVPRLATEEEKDALLAFLINLQRPPRDLFGPNGEQNIHWPNFYVRAGAKNFVSEKCINCHDDAGGNNFFTGFNSTLDTGIAARFGGPDSRTQFNTPALNNTLGRDRFFHGFEVETLTEAIQHYDTSFFNNSEGGQLVGGINLNNFDVFTIKTFLRALNAQTNLRQFANPRVGELPMEELEDAVKILPGFLWQKYWAWVTLQIARWGEFHGDSNFGQYLTNKAQNIAMFLDRSIGRPF